ncbi:hypothetical protein ACSZMW_16940 [Aeromonas allosaccharophila]
MKFDSLVLVINCGSSSVKFSVLDSQSCEVVISGMADGIETTIPNCKWVKSPLCHYLKITTPVPWLPLRLN